MANQSLKSARQIAVEVLNQFDPERNYATTILNKLLYRTTERQRATDLVFGSIRNRMVLDTVIARLSGQPIERIAARLLNILRIATFELICAPETPEYSIVNEAVENAKAIGGKKHVGFVNAVLRQTTRHITKRQVNFTEANLRNTIPQTATTVCEFDPSTTDLLPDDETSPDAYLSAAFSLPKWLVTDWLGQFGTELTHQICIASNRKPSIYIRPNRLKTTTKELAQQLRQANIDFEIISESRSHPSEPEPPMKVKSPKAVTELPGFAEGLFTVQDIASSKAVEILEPQPDWTILDLCAAPGVKTTQLAELTGDSARIIATDINSRRLQKVKANTARLAIESISTVAYENLESHVANVDRFDAVLLDVPCSNTGVLSKRPEVRFRIREDAVTKLTKIQTELLEKTSKLVKPAGKICYSTCSIEPAENNLCIQNFLHRNRRFRLKSELLTLPSVRETDCDGGYVAVLVRR